MILDRSRNRRRGRRALLVMRSPTRQQHQQMLAETARDQAVVVLPAERAQLQEQEQARGEDGDASSGPIVPTPPSLATTQRLLLAHAQRARHLLSHRSTVEALSRSRRREMVEEIERLKRTMRSLQQEIAVTTRNVEAMENLAAQLHNITRSLLDPTDAPPPSVGGHDTPQP